MQRNLLFTFMHLPDAIIQSDSHCIEVYILSVHLGIKPITLLLLVSFAQVTKSVCMVYTVAANSSVKCPVAHAWLNRQTNDPHGISSMCVTLSMLLWLLFTEGVTLAWFQDMTERGLCLWPQLMASAASEPNTVWLTECDESTSACFLLDICTLILDFHQASGLKGQAVRHKFSKLCVFSHQSQRIFLTSASSGLHAQNEAVILTVIMMISQVHHTAV